MTDLEIARRYLPCLHMDRADTIPLRAIGYTVFHETADSRSFPGRRMTVPEKGMCLVEYACYFDYDAEHMYDLEHVFVLVGKDGHVADAQGSFHGKVMNLLVDGIPGVLQPEGDHVHVFCQPGKHAMLASGFLTKLYPGWDTCCIRAGGPVLIGNPFSRAWSPTGEDLFIPTESDNMHSRRYLLEELSFTPTLDFSKIAEHLEDYLMPWSELYERIPQWIRAECRRLDALYGGGT